MTDDAETFTGKLRGWKAYYCHRPHGGFGGQSPRRSLERKTTAQA